MCISLFYCAQLKNVTKISEKLKQAYGDEPMVRAQFCTWHKNLKKTTEDTQKKTLWTPKNTKRDLTK